MDEKSKTTYKTGSLLFVGSMFIGMGLGMYFGMVAVGVMIGMGIGFIAMGVFQLLTEKRIQIIRTMKTKAIIPITVFLLATNLVGFSQETKSNKVSGGLGYFMVGYTGFNLGGMNTLLKDNGYPELTNGSFTFGGGGHFIVNNFIIGGEGHGLSGSKSSNANYDLAIGGGYGFFNLGYIVYNNPTVNIYPLLGFGGGGATIGITDKSKIPENFNDLLENPARESYITNGGFMMNLSIGADFFIAGAKNENFSGGWIMGIKAGYIYNTSGDDWYFNNEKIAGSPNAGISGPYVRLTIGGGGLGK